MIGADAIVKCLEEEKVKYVFGYPGVAICPFYNSILDSSIETILVRTEQNCHSLCRQHPSDLYYRTGKFRAPWK